MTQPGIDPQSPGPLANTLLIRPMAQIALNSLSFLINMVNVISPIGGLYYNTSLKNPGPDV